MSEPNTITSNERILAALAHSSVLLSFFGPIVPALVWIIQRRKSRFVSFQALQAMGYQSLLLWVGLSIVLIGLLVFLFSGFPLAAQESLALEAIGDSLLTQRAMLFQNILYGAWAMLCLPGIIGAVMCALGREFRYPILGNRLGTFLKFDAEGAPFIDEAREDDWVAGLCHSSAIVIFWGMILPLLVWTVQKNQSKRLRFQALQAFLFQLLEFAVTLFSFFLLLTVMIAVVALAGYLNSSQGISSDAGLYLLIAVFVLLLTACLMLLALPTFHLFAMIAWVRVTKGGDYRYPLLGKMIEKRMGRKSEGGS